MLRRSLKKRGARLLLRFSATGLGELVAGYVSLLNRLLHNDSGDIELNGEGWLLSLLACNSAELYWMSGPIKAIGVPELCALGADPCVRAGRRVAFLCLLGACSVALLPALPIRGDWRAFPF